MQSANDITLKSREETRNLATYKSRQDLSSYISVYLLRLRLDLVYIYPVQNVYSYCTKYLEPNSRL